MRRQQIMIAARRVILEKGYGRATMMEIAKESELSAGSLYLYFKNKEELYASLSVRILQYLLIRLEHASQKVGASPDERFEGLKNALLDMYNYDAPLLINMFNLQSNKTLKTISFELLTEIKDLSRKILGKIATILKGSMEEEILSDYHPVALADIIWGIFSGIVLREKIKQVVNVDENLFRRNFELAFEIFISGLRSSKYDYVFKFGRVGYVGRRRKETI